MHIFSFLAFKQESLYKSVYLSDLLYSNSTAIKNL